MSPQGDEVADGMRQSAEVLACLAGGALLGAVLAFWLAPGSSSALLLSMLLFPATVLLGWMLMFPLAVLLLPFMIPRFIRWLRDPQPAPKSEERQPREATAAGWLFVVAALPTSLVAGLVAGAPVTYLLAGLLYGYGLRHSAALQDVTLE